MNLALSKGNHIRKTRTRSRGVIKGTLHVIANHLISA